MLVEPVPDGVEEAVGLDAVNVVDWLELDDDGGAVEPPATGADVAGADVDEGEAAEVDETEVPAPPVTEGLKAPFAPVTVAVPGLPVAAPVVPAAVGPVVIAEPPARPGVVAPLAVPGLIML